MRSLSWRAVDQVARAKRDIWRYLVPSVSAHKTLLDAGALLQMRSGDVLDLASVHFLLSEPVSNLVSELPLLLRQLAPTTELEVEQSAERLRGPVSWGRTFAARGASGNRYMYVTTPARRAFDSPENELLVIVLDAVTTEATRIGWVGRGGEAASVIGQHARAARHARESHMLRGLRAHPLRPRQLSRIKSGRFARRYRSAIDAYELLRQVLQRLDRGSVKELVENHALAIAEPGTLFEVVSTFDVLEQIEKHGWRATRTLGLIRGRLRFAAERGEERLDLWYQSVPRSFRTASRYVATLDRHDFEKHSVRPLRPDLVLRRRSANGDRWLVVEMKMGDVTNGGRGVADSARSALVDLLAYRRDFDAVLSLTPEPYGLGLVWGAELEWAEGEVMLVTPDKLSSSLAAFLGSAAG
jgi:hypothetical protein